MTTRRRGIGFGLAFLVVGLAMVGEGFVARHAAVAAEANKCGCYADTAGNCYCNKNAKCGCPGECEPKNCEAQRQKQFDREIQAETRKAAASGRKSSDGSASKEPAREKTVVREMTASQKRELSRLLTLYLSERPDDRGKAVGDLVSDLARAERTADKADSKGQ